MNSETSSFHTTRWTLVRLASDRGEAGRQALSELCASAYEPVVAFLRRSGRDEDAAREAAHGFFARLLETPALGGAEPGRGRFRSYLLGALKHHLSHEAERQARQKRGGSVVTVPLGRGTETSPGVDPRDDSRLPPDREFDRQWALHVLQAAMNSLSAEWTAAGRADEFAALQPFIGGEPPHGSLAVLALARGADASTLRKTLSRLRSQFRQHVKAQIAPTLDQPDGVESEMRDLLAALAG